jgi:hypothetical protein
VSRFRRGGLGDIWPQRHRATEAVDAGGLQKRPLGKLDNPQMNETPATIVSFICGLSGLNRRDQSSAYSEFAALDVA